MLDPIILGGTCERAGEALTPTSRPGDCRPHRRLPGLPLSSEADVAQLKGLPSRLGSAPSRVRAMPKKAEGFYQSKKWRVQVRAIKRQRWPWCERCGSGHRLAGDHKIERKDGGAELDPANIELLVQPCHNRKTALARAARVQER